jgi:UDP-N-acetylmuramoyl-tripeptide--D-alanyl-D-alanine ligase
MMELGDHAQSADRELGILVARGGVSRLCAIGQFAETVAAGATGAGMNPEKIFIGSHEEIVDALKGNLGPGDWILVKGSRLMAMENVVEGLRKAYVNGES